MDTGHRLEAFVYLELRRRGYEVSIGVIDQLEVDFVAVLDGVTTYYQVSATVQDEATYHREIKSLKLIRDHYRKILLTMDTGRFNDEGIEQINLIEWLLK